MQHSARDLHKVRLSNREASEKHVEITGKAPYYTLILLGMRLLCFLPIMVFPNAPDHV